MAYDGYLTFAGTELLNRARVKRYVDGAAPGLLLDCDCDCGDLHEVVGDQPYTNPALDDAPWYDPDVPASAGFLGLYPVSVIGLDDSTREVRIAEAIGTGGSVAGRRVATREVRVRGLLMGTSDASVQYGQDWLSSVLGGSCESCHGDALCYFGSCPDVCEAPKRLVRNQVDPQAIASDGGNWDGLTWTLGSAGDKLWTPRLRPPIPCSVSYTWTVQGPAGTTVWVWVSGEGSTSRGMQSFVLTGDVQQLTVDDGGYSERWVASYLTLGTEPDPAPIDSLTVHKVEVTHSVDDRSPFDAGTTYLRQLREVVTIEGPRQIREMNTGRMLMREVDFTMSSLKGYTFSQEIPIAGLRSGRVDTTTAGSILTSSISVPMCETQPSGIEGDILFNASMPLEHASVGPYGIIDPDAPRTPPPPILPPLVPPAGSGVPEDNYIIMIPGEALPEWTDMMPVMRFTTGDRAARNVRVRIFPAPIEGMTHLDLDGCDACSGFLINYIPPNSEFTLDGMIQRASIRFNGTNTEYPANHLMSSIDRANIFDWPSLSCGIGYIGVVDIDWVTVNALTLSLVARR